jgi:hypothetical protein
VNPLLVYKGEKKSLGIKQVRFMFINTLHNDSGKGRQVKKHNERIENHIKIYAKIITFVLLTRPSTCFSIS